MFLCQREVWHNLSGHPVGSFYFCWGTLSLRASADVISLCSPVAAALLHHLQKSGGGVHVVGVVLQGVAAGLADGLVGGKVHHAVDFVLEIWSVCIQGSPSVWMVGFS